MAKLERKAYMTFIDSTFKTSGNPTWFLIGKDFEELTVELNPDTETITNILGETSVKDNGYSPEMDADPYYANTDDAIYEKIKDIAMKRLTGDACKTRILEVIVEDTEGPTYEAHMENVIVKPQSYGGDTSGFSIPFNVMFDGGRKHGTVSSLSAPEFTEA